MRGVKTKPPTVSRETREWTRSSADEHAVANGCYFELAAAERVRTFFHKFLRQSKGEWANKPFDLLDWQWNDLIAPLFGWKGPDGRRRYRKAYVEVPKKNGKSTLSSGIALYLLVADNEPGAEVYAAAADRDQATIVFNESANMVEASPDLSRRLEVVRSTKRIIYPASRGFYKALSAENATKEGLNIHGLIFDELHAQPDRRLWDTLTYGGAARAQPLLLSITTAGTDRHSICWEQHEYARNVLDGVFYDDTFFAYIRGANEKDDWKSEATWRKANPSFGVTINAEAFAADCQEAQNSPPKENAFKRYRLNLWTEQVTRWLQLEAWDACGEPFDPADLEGEECFAGMDLSTKIDLTALVLYFPAKRVILPFFWVPKDTAERRGRRDRVPYPQWIREGWIHATDGNVIDFEFVRAKINELAGLYQIKQLAYDPWSATQLALQLQGDGLPVVEYRQGYASMSEATKELEKLVVSGQLRHGGHPVLRWNARNVSVDMDPAGNLKPSKEKSTERIDGLVASIMAIGVAGREAPVEEWDGSIQVV